MMSLYDFLALPFTGQCYYLWKKATYLCCREEETQLVFLYSGGRFFVEVWFDAEALSLVKIRPFTHPKLLEAYWQAVDIGSLLV